MKKNLAPLLLALFALCSVLLLTALPAAASTGQPQAYIYTPTAQPDGRIIYKVQPGDTCIGVSLRMGVSIEQIQLLNNIRGECSLIAGSDLVLGTVEVPPTPSGPTASPTALVATSTPFAGFGEICVRLFDDKNGNARLEDGELPLLGGAIQISDRLGKVNQQAQSEVAPVCFKDLPEGEYSVAMGVPEGFNATTRTNYTLPVKAGDQSILDFGAQISSAAVELPVSEGGRNPTLALVGGAVLLLAAGLGVFSAFNLYKRSTRVDKGL
jgi:LysM repeat protein